MSDRLIRKAEAGGALELKSIAQLAGVYSSREHPLTPQNLLADPSAALPPKTDGDARRLMDWLDAIWNNGRLEAINQLAGDPLTFHCELGILQRPSELRRRVESIRRSFSQFCLQVHETLEAGGVVLCRWKITMTHSGAWRGIEPTHRQIAAWGTTSVRFESGRIVEGSEYWDPKLFECEGDDSTIATSLHGRTYPAPDASLP